MSDGTMWGKVWEESFLEATEQNPGLIRWLREWDRNTASHPLRQVIHQSFHSGFDPIAVYATAHRWKEILEGRFATFRVEVGVKPVKDDMIDEQNHRLKRLPHPFSATFTGGLDSDDGCFEWSKPIRATVNNERPITLRPHWLPLEVGYERVWSLSEHFDWTSDPCGVARWPYGFDEIWCIVQTPKGRALAEKRGAETLALYDELEPAA